MVVRQRKAVFLFNQPGQILHHFVIEFRNFATTLATEMAVSVVGVSIRVMNLVEAGRQSVDQPHLVETFQSPINRGQVQARQCLAGLIVDLLSGQVVVPVHFRHQLQQYDSLGGGPQPLVS